MDLPSNRLEQTRRYNRRYSMRGLASCNFAHDHRWFSCSARSHRRSALASYRQWQNRAIAAAAATSLNIDFYSCEL